MSVKIDVVSIVRRNLDRNASKPEGREEAPTFFFQKKITVTCILGIHNSEEHAHEPTDALLWGDFLTNFRMGTMSLGEGGAWQREMQDSNRCPLLLQ